MKCTCKAVFCWHCAELFDSDNDCYEHLTAKHGGIFDPFDE